MLVGKPVSQTWTLGEKGLFKLAGFTHVVPNMSAPMHCYATEEAAVVIVRVQGQHPVLVAKPIREAPKTEEKRMPVQDYLDINRLGKIIVSRGDWLGNPANFKGAKQ